MAQAVVALDLERAKRTAIEAADKGDAALSDEESFYIRAGNALIDVKKGLPHGAWLPWVETEFKRSPTRAKFYMQLARGAADQNRSVFPEAAAL